MGIAACTSCHSPNGYGVPQIYPRVAGQYRDYLTKQLLAYKSGHRQSRGEIMNDIAFLLIRATDRGCFDLHARAEITSPGGEESLPRA